MRFPLSTSYLDRERDFRLFDFDWERERDRFPRDGDLEKINNVIINSTYRIVFSKARVWEFSLIPS